MTFSSVRTRLRVYWWLLPLFLLISLVAFLPRVQGSSYLASISLGIQYNNPALPDAGEELTGYTESLDDFSTYLTNRFTSVEVQDIVARAMETSIAYSEVKAFYKVTNQGGGFVNLFYEAGSVAEAEAFLTGTKTAYQTVVEEWNSTRLTRFQITPQTDFVEVVTEQEASLQMRAIPVLSGVLLGLLILLVLPLPKKIQNQT